MTPIRTCNDNVLSQKKRTSCPLMQRLDSILAPGAVILKKLANSRTVDICKVTLLRSAHEQGSCLQMASDGRKTHIQGSHTAAHLSRVAARAFGWPL